MWRIGIACICIAAISGGRELSAQEDDFGRGKPEGKPRLLLDTGGHTAQVRALVYSGDGERLYSAGLDKIVMGWQVLEAKSRGRQTSIGPAQTLHWEISRGMRGTIMELATPAEGAKRWLAIGGVSARNGGDITVHDASQPDGQVLRTLTNLQGALATGGLTFSPDGSKLAAVSVFGDTWVWSFPDFKATPLRPIETRDEEKLDRPYRALAFLDNNVLAAAIPFGDPKLDRWNIALYDVRREGNQALILRHEHQGVVTAIVRDPHSARWATADKGGEVFLWEGFDPKQKPTRVPTEREPLDVAFGPKGSFFVATRLAPQKDTPGVETAYLEHWRLDPIRWVEEFVTSTQLDNYACAVSPDQKWLATCGDDDAPVLVFPLRDAKGELAEKPLAGRPLKLRGMGSAVGKVAFAVTDTGEYQVGFGSVEQSGRAEDFNKYGSPRRVFDLSGGRLLPEDSPLPEFRSPEDPNRQWSLRVAPGRRRLVLTSKATESCTITLDPSTQGEAMCYCFLAEGETTFGLAVGTNHQNGVFVYELAKQGECRLLRYYRDHNYVVTSLSVSDDGRYLASASLDQTIKIWSLDGLRSKGKGDFKHVAGWGADFVKSEEHLIAQDVRPAGIAFARGLRDGDILDTLAIAVGRGRREHQGADKILDVLNSAGLFEQLTIKVQRDGRVEDLPQIVPAWEPVATLFVGLVGGREEWALFTPQGPYQTSVNGDQLFGWQFNMGLDATPDFFRAERLRGDLEKPEVLQNLFKSLAAELMDSQLTELAANDDRVRRASLRTPVVKILSPLDAEKFGAEKPVSIRARIFYPEAAKPSEYSVFALLNGGDVGQPRMRTIESKKHRTEIIEWQVAAAERDNRLAIQVQKKGDPMTAPFDHQLVTFRAEVPGARPKLHTLLIAASTYPLGRLHLPFPVNDADALENELRARSGDLYESGEKFRLVDGDISQAKTPAQIEKIANDLKTAAKPGDLLVIYISGHGAVYKGKYYFVPPDEKLHTLGQQDQNLVEQIGLPWESLLPLRETPCRKLVLLDTCHSGNAVLENDSLGHHKALTRPLRQLEMLVVSATSVGQSARGLAGKGGFFTQCLRDGLAGYADGFAADDQRLDAPDAEVDALELVRYVTAEVPRRTRAIEVHTPMHSPEQLFKSLHIPLTRFNPANLKRAPVAAAPARPKAAAAAVAK
jgi:WD40 repeat protein